MSMHNIELTELEREGLEKHKLAIGEPSQLSDSFRAGIAWALGNSERLTNTTPFEERLKEAEKELKELKGRRYQHLTELD